MAKEKPICSNCGSEDYVRDAWAEWDFASQQWVLSQSFDDGYCRTCEQTDGGEWVEIETYFAITFGEQGSLQGQLGDERFATYDGAEQAAEIMRFTGRLWASVTEIEKQDPNQFDGPLSEDPCRPYPLDDEE